MSCAIVIQGAIGSGKTRACLRLAERARSEGLEAGGVICTRVFEGGGLIGYDGLDPASGESFPLSRLRNTVDGLGWFGFGNLIYSFSSEGFTRANGILKACADGWERLNIVFIDEFGRLERAKLGLYTGASMVAESLKKGGIAVFTCRSDLVGSVEEFLMGRARRILIFEPNEEEAILRAITEHFPL